MVAMRSMVSAASLLAFLAVCHAATAEEGVEVHPHEGFNETVEDCSPKEGCDAYPCYEKIANCGPKSYLIAYAEKYCHRFTSDDVYDRFDDEGKAFVNCTRICLLDDMSDYFKVHTKGIDCGGLANDAFDSHTSCYLTCGFCNMCKSNKMALYHAYYLSDFLSYRALKQVFKVMGECGVFECFGGDR